MHGNHMKHMLIGGAGLLAVLLAFGVPLSSALPYAVFLACPLMMLMMMRSMGGGGGHGGGGHDHGPDQSPVPEPGEHIEAPTGSFSEDGFTPIQR
jgi:Protein of unknown function (DUF2933)